ncbi:uncharacterized protein LOC135824790 [Sycon ciliatum]|uniref:uncharacterized protein LOC135824790 n=1 Tax=Sycon ciliatum TaxID=27933 RepID=UPI0031F63A40
MAGPGIIPSFLCLLSLLFAVNAVAATYVAPSTAANGSAHDVEPTSSPPYNCLVQWLILAGASPTEAQTYAASAGVVKLKLDEMKISTLGDIVLELLLAFNSRLVNNLKICVARNASCPTDLASVTPPCGEGGTCRHHSRHAKPTCVCPLGLRGQQCQSDVDECSDASLNNCADPAIAVCLNTHGSFACECANGYYGDGRICKDVNECTYTPSPCHEHANCNNTLGSFTCTCKNGYHGNGLHCQADICTSSLDSNLCREVKYLKQQNKQVDKKIDQRDRQMSRLLYEFHSMATAFRAYHDEITSNINPDRSTFQEEISNTIQEMRSTLNAENDRLREDVLVTKSELQQTKSELQQTKSEHQQTKSELQETKAMVKNIKAALITSNAMVIDTKAMVKDNKAALIDTKAMVNDNKASLIFTKAMVNDTKSDLLSTFSTMATKSQLHTAKKHLNMEVDAMRSDLTNVEHKQSTTCGIVAWKTFRKETGTSRVNPMNVIYNKTRADTVLRIMYTATFGSYHSSTWTDFTISILINNTDCQDPGPIKSGVSNHATASANVFTILPGAISGVCHINTAGPLRITTKLALNSGSYMYEGNYHNSAQRITSSLHVEEMCPNGIE